MSDPFLHCDTCACLFLTRHDLFKHKTVCGENGEWHKNDYGGYWAFAEKMPRLVQAVRANGKLTLGGFDITLDSSGKYLRKKVSYL